MAEKEPVVNSPCTECVAQARINLGTSPPRKESHMQAKSLKALIADHGVSFDASTIMNALLKAGYAENFEYASTTGNGVMKSFKKLTEQAETFGINKPSMGHPFKTETRFFSETFPQLLRVVVDQLHNEVKDIEQR